MVVPRPWSAAWVISATFNSRDRTISCFRARCRSTLLFFICRAVFSNRQLLLEYAPQVQSSSQISQTTSATGFKICFFPRHFANFRQKGVVGRNVPTASSAPNDKAPTGTSWWGSVETCSSLPPHSQFNYWTRAQVHDHIYVSESFTTRQRGYANTVAFW